MVGASPPAISPTAKSAHPAANGTAGPRRSASRPATIVPTSDGEQVRAEDPAVEREVAEVVLDHRQHGRDRERLEAHERDGEDEAARQRPAGRREDPARVRCIVGPSRHPGHRPIMASP